MKNANTLLLAPACIFLTVAALCQQPAAKPKAEVPASTQTVKASTMSPTVDQLYRSDNMPDPFVAAGMGGEVKRVQTQTAAAPIPFSIHDLTLTGIMEDSKGKQAVFSNLNTGISYVLTGGKLFDVKKKPVHGISGVIQGKQVILMTEEEDVQPFNLHDKTNK